MLEDLEVELIKKLQNTHNIQQEVYEELEKVLNTENPSEETKTKETAPESSQIKEEK